MKRSILAERISGFLLLFSFVIIANSPLLLAQKKFGINAGDTIKPKVTFIELGSVRCIPCKQMQAVMKSIETKYSNQVKVIFYDVWTQAVLCSL